MTSVIKIDMVGWPVDDDTMICSIQTHRQGGRSLMIAWLVTTADQREAGRTGLPVVSRED